MRLKVDLRKPLRIIFACNTTYVTLMHFLTNITHKNILRTQFTEYGCYELGTERALWHCRPRPRFETA